LWKYALSLLLGVVIPVSICAQDAPRLGPARLVELTSDMVVFNAPTAGMFLGWQRNANALAQFGFDAEMNVANLRRPDRPLGRLGVFALFSGASLVVNWAFSLTAHDEAHLDAARSIGATSAYLVSVSGGQSLRG
jgi:hypothetical protein